jgi:uncharacterized membrane protein YhaH (DUF805 family)
MVGFGEAIKRAFAGWSNWSGRASRPEFWWFVLFVWLLSLIPYVPVIATAGGDDGGNTLWLILLVVVWLAFVLPYIAVLVRRLHDTDRSGWWYWIALIPCIGVIWLIVLLASPGTAGPNKYGAPSV